MIPAWECEAFTDLNLTTPYNGRRDTQRTPLRFLEPLIETLGLQNGMIPEDIEAQPEGDTGILS